MSKNITLTTEEVNKIACFLSVRKQNLRVLPIYFEVQINDLTFS